ncbi:MAG: hypothetical protein KF868_20410 [Acidobacteria bacterium]|nr:hypothetical protein [Acidobacteriota bacterium]MCW5969667.1 hypothetical protein [Blastocatellales bacterium]
MVVSYQYFALRPRSVNAALACQSDIVSQTVEFVFNAAGDLDEIRKMVDSTLG